MSFVRDAEVEVNQLSWIRSYIFQVEHSLHQGKSPDDFDIEMTIRVTSQSVFHGART